MKAGFGISSYFITRIVQVFLFVFLLYPLQAEHAVRADDQEELENQQFVIAILLILFFVIMIAASSSIIFLYH